MRLSPLRFTTRSLIVVTKLWAHNTTITLGQLLKTRVTVALIKAFLGDPGTMTTSNQLLMFQAYALAQQVIHVDKRVIEHQVVVNRRSGLYLHFGQAARS